MSINRNRVEDPGHSGSALSDENVIMADRSYRYERKFLIENSRLQSVEGVVRLHPAAFFSIYWPRIINNIYLDTPCFSNYRNAVDGIANRLKARIRWYGDLHSPASSPRLEIKGKEGYVSYKSVFPLNDFQFPPRIDTAWSSSLFDAAELPCEIRNYLAYTRPVLVNRYRRKYWRTRDERYRLTLDHQICFSGFTAVENQNLQQPIDDTNVILEIKYDLAKDSSFADIANKFPFRQSRSSKYVAGIDQVYQLGNYY
jgi:hypothetical protein